ncbi:MAG: hypothetical protein PHV68_05375 [Candidatus Gastranaerophilales bacterium]|nr:hypothetical protein [Candidatus Gastranaerophilales bacterium]
MNSIDLSIYKSFSPSTVHKKSNATYSYSLQKNQTDIITVSSKKNNFSKKGVLTGSLISAVGFLSCILLYKNSAPIRSKAGKIILNSKQVEIFKKQINEFAADIDYRKDLLKAMGLKAKDYAVLRPIIGPEEYKGILKNFNDSPMHYSPGDILITEKKDGYNLFNKDNGIFRANLHMHTEHSDGKMTVAELLDQAAKYADDVFDKMKNLNGTKAPNAPFTVAITDHDTVEGCKEAVDIISKNPWKYRNLRVVLGCELSVENKSIPQKLKSPINIHMLLHSLNPFDENLNKLLNDKKEHRINLIKSIIAKSAQNLRDIAPGSAFKLNCEDAKNLHPVLKHGQTHVDLATKDYVQFRTIFSECFENNKSLQDELKEKSVNIDNLNYLTPKEKYFNTINQDFGNNYWKKYQKALTKQVSELLEISEQEASDKIKISSQLSGFFDKVQTICNDTKPKMDLQEVFIDMDDAIKFMKNQKYGYMGIAHPGLINVGEKLSNPSESYSAIKDMFKIFKQKGEDKALFSENHYHYYGNIYSSKDWMASIKKYSENNSLLNSGGLDSHGKSIFYSGR